MKLIPFVIKNKEADSYPSGWGNGYVGVPPEHKYHGKHYGDFYVDVHGGLTYSGKAGCLADSPKELPEDYWVFGFDTAHLDDDLNRWPEALVWEETHALKEELEEVGGHTVESLLETLREIRDKIDSIL